MRRLGIFGGSFDPPHNAHLEIARLATDQLPLDELYFIPAYHAPLKDSPPRAAAEHRLEMTRLLAQQDPRWQTLAFEMEQARPVPAVQTLAYLQKTESGKELFWLIGGDQAARFTEWVDWEHLLKAAQLVCFARGRTRIDPAVEAEMQFIMYRSEISSTMVRESLQRGESAADLLPASIQAYINAHSLYQ